MSPAKINIRGTIYSCYGPDLKKQTYGGDKPLFFFCTLWTLCLGGITVIIYRFRLCLGSAGSGEARVPEWHMY